MQSFWWRIIPFGGGGSYDGCDVGRSVNQRGVKGGLPCQFRVAWQHQREALIVSDVDMEDVQFLVGHAIQNGHYASQRKEPARMPINAGNRGACHMCLLCVLI